MKKVAIFTTVLAMVLVLVLSVVGSVWLRDQRSSPDSTPDNAAPLHSTVIPVHPLNTDETNTLTVQEPPKTRAQRVLNYIIKHRHAFITAASVLLALAWIATTSVLIYRRVTLFPAAPLPTLLFDMINPRFNVVHVDAAGTGLVQADQMAAVVGEDQVNYVERIVLIFGILGVVIYSIAFVVCLVIRKPLFEALKMAGLATVFSLVAEGLMFGCILFL
jgi:hypothetical protein